MKAVTRILDQFFGGTVHVPYPTIGRPNSSVLGIFRLGEGCLVSPHRFYRGCTVELWQAKPKGRNPRRVPLDDFVLDLLIGIDGDKPQVVTGRGSELLVSKARQGIVEFEVNGKVRNLRRSGIARESDDARKAPCRIIPHVEDYVLTE